MIVKQIVIKSKHIIQFISKLKVIKNTIGFF